MQSTLRDLFGERTVANGRIDKAYLASLIAADAKKRVLLDEYVHPLVKNEIERRLRDSTSTKTVLDVPLLFESGLDQICDFIITVVSDEKQKSARIVLRGKDPKVALQMNAGWPLRQARAKSSVIIENNGTVNELLDKLHKLDKIL